MFNQLKRIFLPSSLLKQHQKKKEEGQLYSLKNETSNVNKLIKNIDIIKTTKENDSRSYECHELNRQYLNKIKQQPIILTNDSMLSDNTMLSSNSLDTLQLVETPKLTSTITPVSTMMPIKEPVKAQVKEPVKAQVKEPVEEVVKEPVKKPVKESVKAQVKEVVVNPTIKNEKLKMSTNNTEDELKNTITLLNNKVVMLENKAILLENKNIIMNSELQNYKNKYNHLKMGLEKLLQNSENLPGVLKLQEIQEIPNKIIKEEIIEDNPVENNSIENNSVEDNSVEDNSENNSENNSVENESRNAIAIGYCEAQLKKVKSKADIRKFKTLIHYLNALDKDPRLSIRGYCRNNDVQASNSRVMVWVRTISHLIK